MFYTWFFKSEITTTALFVELALAGFVVVLAGYRFTKLADMVADRLNLGAGWVGLILLASVTSLPELVTGGTATSLGNIDLAFGGLLGSCSFNITIIFLLNALCGGGSVLRDAGKAHALSSSFGLLLIGLALLGMVLMDKFSGSPIMANRLEWAWVILIAFTYLFCIKLIYRYECSQNGASIEGVKRERGRLGSSLIVQIALIAGILVAASWWLAKLGDVLSVHEIGWIGRPLGATFVGACFLALATSLPEIATSVAAVKLGKLDLALGNIFGSNMFNIAVIPVLKIISASQGDAVMLSPGASDPTSNLITGLIAILLTTVAIGGITYQSRRKVFRRFGFDSLVIIVIYLGGMSLLVMS